MQLGGVDHSVPPEIGEVEVSLFGPGYGESIVVHLGQNEWVVVDSCLDRKSKSSAPLQYLRKIGVDVSSAVKLVVASHWHDDHIRGLSEVYESAAQSKFVCSAALTTDEFLELVQLSGSLMSENTGLREFRKILDTLKERGGSRRQVSIGPEFAVEGKVLWRRASGVPGEIQALSPSSSALTLAFNEFSRLIPRVSDAKRRMVSQRPNHVAVALWITIGSQSILLGSDLEETGNPATGWSVIVGSTVRPNARAKLFKVPHHGSVTAEQPMVWTNMLESSPVAMVTSFVSGQVLPTGEDVARIMSRTSDAYITSLPKRRVAKIISRTVEKAVKDAVKSIKEVPASTGQLRFRCKDAQKLSGEWYADLYGTACHLSQMLDG